MFPQFGAARSRKFNRWKGGESRRLLFYGAVCLPDCRCAREKRVRHAFVICPAENTPEVYSSYAQLPLLKQLQTSDVWVLLGFFCCSRHPGLVFRNRFLLEEPV